MQYRFESVSSRRQREKTGIAVLRDDFIAWQCRIRQIAMRADGGRPSPGMRPRVLDDSGGELAPALTVLLVPQEPAESTAFFRFQVMRSADPRDLYQRGLAYLQADYFHRPQSFSDRMTAVLDAASPLAAKLLDEKHCVLAFDQFSQRWRLPCAVARLAADDPAREASVWHNRIFNPLLPDDACVLQFKPDWRSAAGPPC
jgi:hypothetical protein